MIGNRGRAALAAASLAVAAAGWAVFVPIVLPETRLVEFPPGTSVRGIAAELKRAGLVRSAWVFALLARGMRRPLHAGEYGFRAGSTWTILRNLQEGRVYLHKFLVPEGEALDRIAAALAAGRLGEASRFRAAAADPGLLRTLGIPARSAEGYLFPDTYLLPKGMREDRIVAMMARRFKERVPSALEGKARARGLTFHELVTFASIVEKEARAPEERTVIAGVFALRLKRGMPLQADPTVRYAAGRWEGKLSRADFKLDSPYNTYRIAGLPPGPICSPGLASLRAAVEPADVPYLYFVTRSDGTFRHDFSRTLAEHNEAIRRSNRRQKRAS